MREDRVTPKGPRKTVHERGRKRRGVEWEPRRGYRPWAEVWVYHSRVRVTDGSVVGTARMLIYMGGRRVKVRIQNK